MSVLHRINEIKKHINSIESNVSRVTKNHKKLIDDLVLLRQKYRLEKNFIIADEIRNILSSVDVNIIQGTSQYSTYDEIPVSLRNNLFNDTWETKDNNRN